MINVSAKDLPPHKEKPKCLDLCRQEFFLRDLTANLLFSSSDVSCSPGELNAKGRIGAVAPSGDLFQGSSWFFFYHKGGGTWMILLRFHVVLMCALGSSGTPWKKEHEKIGWCFFVLAFRWYYRTGLHQITKNTLVRTNHFSGCFTTLSQRIHGGTLYLPTNLPYKFN